jgi:hypothetical protein
MSKRKTRVAGTRKFLGQIAQVPKNKCLDGTFVDHKKYTKLYRYKTMKVIKDVRAGIVNEVDIDRLQNFIQFSLALMERATMEDIDKAWRNAEAMSFIHADMEIPIVESVDQYSVHLDPQVQQEATST